MAQPKRKSPEKRSHRRAPPPSRGSRMAAGLWRGLTRYPRLLAGVSIFGVVFSFVAANALWYQPHHHPAPLLATRMFGDAKDVAATPAHPASEEGVTTFRIEREADLQAAAPRPAQKPSALVRDIQTALSARGLYDGPADGLSGAKTISAIQFFQETEGLADDGQASAALLARLKSARPQVAVLENPDTDKPDQSQTASTRKGDDVAALIRAMDEAGETPIPASAYPEKPTVQHINATPDAGAPPVKRVMLIQKALVGLAYGDIKIDGKVGDATRAAIRSFEKAYRLPVTGEPSEVVLKKLKSIGAI